MFALMVAAAMMTQVPEPSPPPPPPPVLVPLVMSNDPERLARMSVLRREISELKLQLDNASLTPPILKLNVATVLTAIALVCVVARFETAQGPSASFALGGVFAVAAATFWLMGILELRTRMSTHEEVPAELQAREAELARLKADG